jgi:aryl-alcohol dehydrogenase-like predicted oxidoreductase
MNPIEKIPFGRTGHLSTRVLFGAAALGSVSQEDADRTLDILLQYGVNHFDTAASYGDAELRMGPWMPNLRDQIFLATKTGERTRQAAWDELQRSLKRLQVDHVDLWQMHNLSDPEEWKVAMAPGGVLEAFLEAREKGLARFLGVTGHGYPVAGLHLKSLERHAFDSVLLPWNITVKQNPGYKADFEELLKVCQERNVAVQIIKSIARRNWGDHPRIRTTWYEPLEEQEEIDKAVHWVLGYPGLFLNSVGDIHVLPKFLEACTRYQAPPSDEELLAIVEKREMASLFV